MKFLQKTCIATAVLLLVLPVLVCAQNAGQGKPPDKKLTQPVTDFKVVSNKIGTTESNTEATSADGKSHSANSVVVTVNGKPWGQPEAAPTPAENHKELVSTTPPEIKVVVQQPKRSVLEQFYYGSGTIYHGVASAWFIHNWDGIKSLNSSPCHVTQPNGQMLEVDCAKLGGSPPARP